MYMAERRTGESKGRWGLWTIAGAGGLALAGATLYLSNKDRRDRAIQSVVDAAEEAKTAVRGFATEQGITRETLTLAHLQDMGRTGVRAFFASFASKGNETAPAGDRARTEAAMAAEQGSGPADEELLADGAQPEPAERAEPEFAGAGAGRV
jgi:hypothetical protein